MQPWCTPLLIWDQSVVPCPLLTVLPDLHIDFSRDRLSGLVFTSLYKFSIVCVDPHSQSFGIVNKAEIDAILELSCFFNNPMDVMMLHKLKLHFQKEKKKASYTSVKCVILKIHFC